MRSCVTMIYGDHSNTSGLVQIRVLTYGDLCFDIVRPCLNHVSDMMIICISVMKSFDRIFVSCYYIWCLYNRWFLTCVAYGYMWGSLLCRSYHSCFTWISPVLDPWFSDDNCSFCMIIVTCDRLMAWAWLLYQVSWETPKGKLLDLVLSLHCVSCMCALGILEWCGQGPRYP